MSNELPYINLRAIEPEDLDVLYRIENDTRLWNVGNTNVPYSKYVLHDYIANASNDIYTDRQVRLMVENKDGEVVGIADIVNFEPAHLRAEIGIVIQTPYRRQGFATAAIRQLACYAARVLHLHQLYVCVDCNNLSSADLFKKAGFSEGIRLKDWLYDGQNYHDAMFMQLFL